MTKLRCLERNCLFCSRPFQAAIKYINAGGAKYCSLSCACRAKPKKIREPNTTCAHCQKAFWVPAQRFKTSKSGLHFCCREHKDIAARIGGIEAIQPDHYGTINSNHHDYRIKALRNYPAVCMRCGFDKYVVVHHKDRNRENNVLENLEILCPNCHAIEHWGTQGDESRTHYF